MAENKKGLGELLVKENLININQLEEARKAQKQHGGRLMTALVNMGHISEKDLAEFLGRQHGLPTIDLLNFEIDPKAIELVSRQVCEKHRVIPVQKSDRTLVVAFADPTNIFVKDDLSLLTRCKIEVVVASESMILKAIEKYYPSSSQLNSLMSEIEDTEEAFESTQVQAEVVDSEAAEGDGPIIKFVNAMLAEAIKLRASDIHIEPYEKRFRIRFRIDGVLHEKTQPPPGTASAIVSRLKILCKMNIAERRRPQDGRLKVRLQNGSEVDFRVNTVPALFGEKMVLRILDKTNLQVDMTRLGFEQSDLALFTKCLHQPQGMLLVTGPTGSGKTVTIYSALAELNKPGKNISTAEDPVEFNLDGINQIQINSEIGFGFPEALRAFLRQDPDVIMVGEIRDYETGAIAYKAASTGHMVLSTLHTNDAASTVTRLVDMGIAPYIVAEATSLVVAQRLIKGVCQRCATETKVAPEVLLELGVLESELHEFNDLRRGEGCSECNGTGLRGRMAIFELLNMSPAVKEAIFRGASPQEIKRHAIQNDNMRTLRRSALLKLKRGLTTVEEVLNSSVGDGV